MPHQLAYGLICWEHFLSLDALFQDDPCLCQTEIWLISTPWNTCLPQTKPNMEYQVECFSSKREVGRPLMTSFPIHSWDCPLPFVFTEERILCSDLVQFYSQKTSRAQGALAMTRSLLARTGLESFQMTQTHQGWPVAFFKGQQSWWNLLPSRTANSTQALWWLESI